MEQKDWMAMLLSAIGGACSAVVGMFAWFGKKLTSFDSRISKLEHEHGRQAEQHLANLREMGRFEDELVNIDNKLDRQTEIILRALGAKP